MPQKLTRSTKYRDRKIGDGVQLSLLEDGDRLQLFEIDKTGVQFRYDKNRGTYFVLKDSEWTVVPPADLAPVSAVPVAARERTGLPGFGAGLPSSAPGGSTWSPELSISTADAPQSLAGMMSADAREGVRFEWITLRTSPLSEAGTDCRVTLHDASGHVVWTIESAPTNEITRWVNDEEIINQKASTPDSHTFAFRPRPKLKGALADAYELFKVTTPGRDQVAVPTRLRVTPPGRGQLAVLTRLRNIHKAMLARTPGHPSTQMTKIPLVHPIQLKIGGQTVDITHLYTQVGNAHELRCYLGNTIPSPSPNSPDADGIYQRVHTSIRDDDGTAHTMVQTSKVVAIPGVTARSLHKGDAPATRIGFDSSEHWGKGEEPPPVPFAARKLSERPKDLSDVGDKSGWVIRGQSWNELKHDELADARLLAERFNAALDLALADLMEELPIDPKTITRLRPGFIGLDPT